MIYNIKFLKKKKANDLSLCNSPQKNGCMFLSCQRSGRWTPSAIKSSRKSIRLRNISHTPFLHLENDLMSKIGSLMEWTCSSGERDHLTQKMCNRSAWMKYSR